MKFEWHKHTGIAGGYSLLLDDKVILEIEQGLENYWFIYGSHFDFMFTNIPYTTKIKKAQKYIEDKLYLFSTTFSTWYKR